MKNVYLGPMEQFRIDYNTAITRGIEHASKHLAGEAREVMHYQTLVGKFLVPGTVRVFSERNPIQHTCGTVAEIEINMPDGRPFKIGVEQGDIDMIPSMEENKEVLDLLLDHMSRSAVQEWMNRELFPMIEEAMTSKNFARLTEISHGLIDCDFGEHFARVVMSDTEGKIQHKVDVDDPEGLFFNETVKPDHFFLRTYLIALHHAIITGQIYKNVPLVLGVHTDDVQA